MWAMASPAGRPVAISPAHLAAVAMVSVASSAVAWCLTRRYCRCTLWRPPCSPSPHPPAAGLAQVPSPAGRLGEQVPGRARRRHCLQGVDGLARSGRYTRDDARGPRPPCHCCRGPSRRPHGPRDGAHARCGDAQARTARGAPHRRGDHSRLGAGCRRPVQRRQRACDQRAAATSRRGAHLRGAARAAGAQGCGRSLRCKLQGHARVAGPQGRGPRRLMLPVRRPPSPRRRAELCLKAGRPLTVPPAALGAMEVLWRFNQSIEGKHVVVIGRSNTVGIPVSSLLLHNDATLTICHSLTRRMKVRPGRQARPAHGPEHLIPRRLRAMPCSPRRTSSAMEILWCPRSTDPAWFEVCFPRGCGPPRVAAARTPARRRGVAQAQVRGPRFGHRSGSGPGQPRGCPESGGRVLRRGAGSRLFLRAVAERRRPTRAPHACEERRQPRTQSVWTQPS